MTQKDKMIKSNLSLISWDVPLEDPLNIAKLKQLLSLAE